MTMPLLLIIDFGLLLTLESILTFRHQRGRLIGHECHMYLHSSNRICFLPFLFPSTLIRHTQHSLAQGNLFALSIDSN